ncbi:MAG: metal-dependent hydrolase [Myxococcales bacterium]|nr:metal-dependent hydrolase [Myxococcales bacterium]
MTNPSIAASLPTAPPAPAGGVPVEPRAARPPITPRPGPRDFGAVPKHWFAGLAVPTQVSNGVNLLFPAGERFFVRSVYYYLDRIDDPALKAAIKGFGGQEGRHARSHEDFFATMRGHGYEIDRFLKVYEWLSFTLLERLAPPALRLAATAAAEHYTAIMAAGAAADVPLELAHPAMRQLLYWHAAEELEHKSVAFDVLQRVNSSYALRLAGLAMSTAMLVSMWWSATLYLLWQDGVTPWQAARNLRELRRQRPTEPIARRVFARGIRAYLRRDFHPDQDDNYHLAAQLLAKAEAAGAELAAAATPVPA